MEQRTNTSEQRVSSMERLEKSSTHALISMDLSATYLWIQPKHDGASDESTCFFRHLSGAGDSFDGSAPKTIDGGRYPIAASNRSIDFSQSSMGACARTYASSAPTTISLAPSFFGRPIIFIARNRSFFRSLAPAACVTPQVRGARAPAGGLS